jgi:murein DD-endopeptidase MepM/ murein hydrolase activator NlpD
VTPTAVETLVPAGAVSGRVRVIGAMGRRSKASTRSVVVGLAAAAVAPVEARVDSKRVFVNGRRKASLSFFVGAAATRVRVELVRDGALAPIATWTPGDAPAGTVQTVEWNAAGGPPPAEGRYEFRVTAETPGVAQAAQAPAPSVSSGFLLLGHMFPVRGPHDFGEFAASFGGGRGHQGQDVFATCGTPLVAASGGKVKFKAFQGRAGNYVVIAGADGFDHAYMHLRDPALVAKGAAVATGQLIGFVGQTGRASGCHLHFERWSAPGWYTGGAPADPLPDLLAWDKLS